MLSLEDLIDKYVEYAIAHGDATESGDYKVANKNYKSIVSVFSRIRQYKEDGALALKKLLKHENSSVVSWSGSHLLENFPDEASSALSSIAIKDGLVAFSAEMVLKEWRKGRLKTYKI